ncbi:MAG: hypothetical protein RRZ64_07530 [Rikenellaceae bacterium]
MHLKHLTVLFLFCLANTFAFAASEETIELDTTIVKQNDRKADTTVVISKSEYNKIFSVKFKKGQGYSKPKKNDRIIKYALLEKYCSYASFNIGFASYDIDNKWIEPVVRVNEAYIHNFNFKLQGGYFVDNNVSVGLAFSYGIYDTKFDVSSDILELLINSKDYNTNNAGYNFRGAAVVKNFIPINKTQRIFLTNITSLWYGYSYYLGRNLYNGGEKITKSTQKTQTVGVGISPGIMYFMSRGFAFEFNFNPISVYYKSSEILNDEIENGNTRSYGLSFDFIPFNIELGFSYYFGLDYVKHSKMVDVY